MSKTLIKQYRKLWDLVQTIEKSVINISFKEEDLDEMTNLSLKARIDMDIFIAKLKAKREKLSGQGKVLAELSDVTEKAASAYIEAHKEDFLDD